MMREGETGKNNNDFTIAYGMTEDLSASRKSFDDLPKEVNYQ